MPRWFLLPVTLEQQLNILHANTALTALISLRSFFPFRDFKPEIFGDIENVNIHKCGYVTEIYFSLNI